MTNVDIDEAELVQLTLDLCNIDSPPGEEGEAAEFVYQWLLRNGFQVRKIGMFPERFNVLGTLAGTGEGYSLIFNSHLDTAKSRGDRWSVRDPDAAIDHSAWHEGELLYGEGVVNDKGPMAAFLIAAKAIKDAAIELKGDLLVSAVPGEIGIEPVDEFKAPQYISKEVGTRYLIQHGGVADFALNAEGTDFKVASIEPGKAFFKITVFGDRQIYTPYAPDAEVSVSHPNAIVRAALLIPHIEDWGRKYQERFTYQSDEGVIIPKVVIGAIRAGNPYHITRTSELCAIYVDVRLIPEQDPLAIKHELIQLLADLGISGTVELFVYRRSYEAGDTEALMDSIRAAHSQILGGKPVLADPPISSMWRDLSIFNEMGIPCVTYGPPRGIQIGDWGHQSMQVEDLVRTAELYATVAVDLCSKTKPGAAELIPSPGEAQTTIAQVGHPARSTRTPPNGVDPGAGGS